ncbi:unnamed protein product [Pleuronectes platessa]|uniref:Uncharacterized protein n=1 Tax=Pleuronectes platessa TaxID=8262 RepID=A0A9N7YP51_PLEPL|nr:unnamed protein product [Pleuronectes platessa]
MSLLFSGLLLFIHLLTLSRWQLGVAPSRPPGKLSQALIAHLTAFKGLTSLPLSKVSIWQHGQRRSSSCQPPNKNSSCSPTIGGLLEASSGIMTEREVGETVSPPTPRSPSHSLTCKPQPSIIARAEAFMLALSFRWAQMKPDPTTGNHLNPSDSTCCSHKDLVMQRKHIYNLITLITRHYPELKRPNGGSACRERPRGGCWGGGGRPIGDTVWSQEVMVSLNQRGLSSGTVHTHSLYSYQSNETSACDKLVNSPGCDSTSLAPNVGCGPSKEDQYS